MRLIHRAGTHSLADRWTLLVIRDMMFLCKQRFEEFLASPERISTNILTSRLRLLEGLGMITKSPYSHSRRMTYRLTTYGNSLRPVLTALSVWGEENLPETRAIANQIKHRESQT
jgi:DNA-binding HxlR family transcriptional regulator